MYDEKCFFRFSKVILKTLLLIVWTSTLSQRWVVVMSFLQWHCVVGRSAASPLAELNATLLAVKAGMNRLQPCILCRQQLLLSWAMQHLRAAEKFTWTFHSKVTKGLWPFSVVLFLHSTRIAKHFKNGDARPILHRASYLYMEPVYGALQHFWSIMISFFCVLIACNLRQLMSYFLTFLAIR